MWATYRMRCDSGSSDSSRTNALGEDERQRQHPGVRGVECPAAGQAEQERVEALVELDVALEGLDGRAVGPHQRV